jgi:GTP-binding protein LepA
MDAGLEIIPVLNKIDLPGAEPEKRAQEIIDLIGAKREEILAVSAKEGTGVPELLEEIVARVPPPRGREEAPLRALIFDSYYDRYRGAVPSIRVVDGVLREGMEIAFGAHPDDVYHVDEVGYLQLGQRPAPQLEAGEVGYLVASLRDVRDARVGDTIFDAHDRATELLPGYREVKSMVFAGLYPTESDQYEGLRDALEKLRLNDASLQYEPESSTALGFGFRCGFLGLLHMEIVQERLEREFDLTLVSTAPTVVYRVTKTDGTILTVDNPAKLPAPQFIATLEEPYILGTILTPPEFLGAVLQLAQEKRGIQRKLHYPEPKMALLTYDFPLNEMVFDFYDRLKSVSRGYASFDYEFLGYRAADLVKLDILINGEPVDALSSVIHRDKAYFYGRDLVKKMRQVIPRQLFEVAIQAAIGSRVIARETVVPLRKNVTAKCYGGDITRKRKLLEKQKEGKRRMKRVGRVEIPQEAFVAVLQVGR